MFLKVKRFIENKNNGMYWGDRNVLYLNCGGDSMSMYKYTFVKIQKSKSLIYVTFMVWKLHIHQYRMYTCIYKCSPSPSLPHSLSLSHTFIHTYIHTCVHTHTCAHRHTHTHTLAKSHVTSQVQFYISTMDLTF